MADKTPSKTPTTVRAPVLQRARLRLVVVQDRLLLDGATHKDSAGKNKEIALWLSRAVVLPLFQQLRSSLEKESATAGKTAVGWRQEALALEHAAILKSNVAKNPGAPWRGESKPQLVTKITVKQAGDQIQLLFWNAKSALAGLVLTSVPLHRFAAMLALRIQQAKWDRGMDLSWLGKAPALQLPPPGKAN